MESCSHLKLVANVERYFTTVLLLFAFYLESYINFFCDLFIHKYDLNGKNNTAALNDSNERNHYKWYDLIE